MLGHSAEGLGRRTHLQALPAATTCRGASSRRAKQVAKIMPLASHARQVEQELFAKQAVAMFTSGAVLGPLCDGQHSSHDVLHYARPSLLSVSWTNYQLETCWWVPILFGIAGIVLGVSHPLLDDVLLSQLANKAPRPVRGFQPSWGIVYLGIALFVLQYYTSGALEQPLMGQLFGHVPCLDIILGISAVGHWAYFDRSAQGLLMAMITAAAGPLLEIGLINGLHLYTYSHPAQWGVPTWIPWVYFCGAPAVGNLGRAVRAELEQEHTKP